MGQHSLHSHCLQRNLKQMIISMLGYLGPLLDPKIIQVIIPCGEHFRGGWALKGLFFKNDTKTAKKLVLPVPQRSHNF